ncbi:MAG: metallophosphoesterase [Bacteroidales bacterium]
MILRIIVPLILFILLFNGVTALYVYFSKLRDSNIIIRLAYSLINIIFISCFTIIVYSLLTNNSTFISPDNLTLFSFFYFLFYLPQILYILFELFGKLIRDKTNTIAGIGLICSISMMATMLWGHFFETKNITIETYDISSHDIPYSFDNYKIVQFSDLHISSFNNDTTFIAKLSNTINSLVPDLVVFTGDLVTLNSNEVSPFLGALSSISSKDGIYAVLGNHDYSEYSRWLSDSDKEKDFNNLKNSIKAINWRLLLDESQYLYRGNDSIILSGIENWGEPPFSAHGDLKKTFKYIKPNINDFTILLSHNPEFWRQIVTKENHPIDLTLSGHTHAMQLILKFAGKLYSPSFFKYKYWGGLYSSDTNHQLIVNRGIGNVFYHMRIGAPPEISLIRLIHQ